MSEEGSPEPGTNKSSPAAATLLPARVESTSSLDPGDTTARNYRYQHSYAVILMVAAKLGLRPYVAVWCEHHEDVLAERKDGSFEGFQIKTSRPELGAWCMADSELTKSIGRFVDLLHTFGDQITQLYFVSNTEFDLVGDGVKDVRRRRRCPKLFLDAVRGCKSRSEIGAPFDETFDELQATCGCEEDELLRVLARLQLVVGPSRNEIDAALSNEHLAKVSQLRGWPAERLNAARDDLVAIVFRASSLHVDSPLRHIRAIGSTVELDPVIQAKRVEVERTFDDIVSGTEDATFKFVGDSGLQLGRASTSVMVRKLVAAGLEEEVDYMKQRALAAEYALLEDVAKRPHLYPDLLQQIEQRVHGELVEASLRARLSPPPYGPTMLVDVQDRLRGIAEQQPARVGYHCYECLIGVAGLLTDECRAWWGPRFDLESEPVR